jgi:hypothetical protein
LLGSVGAASNSGALFSYGHRRPLLIALRRELSPYLFVEVKVNLHRRDSLQKGYFIMRKHDALLSLILRLDILAVKSQCSINKSYDANVQSISLK